VALNVGIAALALAAMVRELQNARRQRHA
jgi:hypothetical protein